MKKLTTLLLGFMFSLTLAQAPATYYDGTTGLTGAALKTKLSAIISAGAIDNGYNGLYNGYPTTDTDSFYENDGSVLDMYSENPNGTDPYNFRHGIKKCGNYSSEGDCYNREHVVPQSFFGSKAPMVSDIHFIRPTDGKVNGMRSNYPFGKVTNAAFTSKNGTKVGPSTSTGYTGTVCEPIDEFKGDIARMIFYFVTRYESKLSGFSSGGMLGNTTYPGLTEWEKNVLLTWAAQDPVSPAEIVRNNASYVFQKNRNPFIDHPEWIQTIWGTQVIDNENPSTPTNLVLNSISTASANLTWTASTDNIGVAYYKVYVNGTFHMNSSTNAVTVSGLTQGTAYNFYVIASDAAGNVSPQSNTVSGTTLIDNEAPTAPTNLTLGSVGTNNIAISWTAATDNVEVASYDMYVNGQLMGSTTSTNSNIANLDPSTTYTIYVVAKDAAGNASPMSNSVTATTLAIGLNCGDENFESIPASAATYSTYNWTSNGISWTSEDSRTDETINGRAITIRDGFLTALSAPNGIGDLTVTTLRKYSGGTGTFKIFINDIDTGKTIPYGATKMTTTVTGLNVSGTVEISLVNTSTKDRVAIDDMKWTCYAGLATNENTISKSNFTIYPNPVKNGELNITGKDLTNIAIAQIFDYSGKLVQTISQPFRNSNKIILKNLPKGVYILKAGQQSAKFIIQ
ncbi:T9SS type A sorting domain-containing protein [Kaistella flava (ex Peng et al. 2021)]|uniref:T9SS type A sorting domain-containing protein n=1 Tax=Kaistella flava (ex Peng et al. 2021) TaxID=2038776 RepID=A0A7M2Y4K2_9FLAO|nr:endonuclease [Kaistella flava (ex Peng et al. 2021)]QOW09026.1 T9SS type A sorting domain-containing protein [Kaistella flava (ex Peng et al. 2021)]